MTKYIITISSLCLWWCAVSQVVSTTAGQLGQSGYEDGGTDSALFNNPHGIACDMEGYLYVADRYNHVIRKISPSGEVVTLAGIMGVVGDDDGIGEMATFYEPWGLCVNDLGEVYVADTRNNKIRKISRSGEVSTVAGNGEYGNRDGEAMNAIFGRPTGIEQGDDGTLYIADHKTHVIRKITAGGWVTTLAGRPGDAGNINGIGAAARFNRPYGLTIDREGNIIVADEWNHAIRKITSEGLVSTLAGTGDVGFADGEARYAQFHYPWDVEVSTNGITYVGDGYNYVIRTISTNQEVSTYAGVPEQRGGINGAADIATFSGVTAVVLSPHENMLYAVDAYNHAIRQVGVERTVTLDLPQDDGTLAYCEGDTLVLMIEGTTAAYYELWSEDDMIWSGEEELLTLPSILAGNYSFYVKAFFGDGEEVQSARTIITVAPNPVVVPITTPPLILSPGGELLLAVEEEGESYYWSTGEEGTSVIIHEVGDYAVTPVEGNCLGEVFYFSVTNSTVEEWSDEAFLPTAFSPNGDGVNDVFRIRGLADDQPFELLVFDHWGNVLFRSNTKDIAWDGTFHQQTVSPATYTYQLKIKDAVNYWHYKVGQVTLHY